MPAGRCSGCGRIDSRTKIGQHVVTCTAYAELFSHSPDECLDPGADYLRYRATTDTPDARAQRRDDRLRGRFAELDRHQAVSVARWRTPPDILDD
jgi:hypothetical protein